MTAPADKRGRVLAFGNPAPQSRGYEVFTYYLLLWQTALAAFKRLAEKKTGEP